MKMNTIKKVLFGTILMTLDILALSATTAGVYPGDAVEEWTTEREFAIDTREHIVVVAPEEVLPIAYSTNFWGGAEGHTMAEVQVREPGSEDYREPSLIDTNVNGYVEWMPEVGAFGKYEFAHVCKGGEGFQKFIASIVYSSPFPLTLATAEGGSFVAITNGVEATGTFDVLGFENVTIAAKPADARWVLKEMVALTNDVELLLEKEKTSITNKFEMPCYGTVVTGAFVIAETYRAELFAAIEDDYLATSNKIESLRKNRLSDAETDGYRVKARQAYYTAKMSVNQAKKPYTADAATNTLAVALAKVESDAKKASDGKPYDLLIASDFLEIADEGSYDPATGTFTVDGRAFQTNVNAFTSFTEAYAEKTYVPFTTNVFVFGVQTLATEPTHLAGWNLVLVPYRNSELATVPVILSIEKDFATDKLISITDTLAEIAGIGTIVLAKTDVSTTIYDDFINERAEILVVNAGTEQQKQSGTVTVDVDDTAKAKTDEETGETGVVLAGIENRDGDIVVTVEESATNDVLVAGTIKAAAGNVTIVNSSTNELILAAVVEAKDVRIVNDGKASGAEGSIRAMEIVATGDVEINNNAHLEANVIADGGITIRNGSFNTIVGTYEGKTITIEGSKAGAISNVTFVSDGPVTMDGVNILTGPFTIDAPEGAITNKGTFAWNLRDGNQVAKLTDFDAVEFLVDSRFQIWVDPEQKVGRYVLAGNAGSLADKDAFQVEMRDGADTFMVSLGEGYVVPAGSKRLYRLDLDEAEALVLTVIDTSTHFDQTAYSVPEGGAVKVYVRGGSMEHAVQATLFYVKNTASYSAAYMDGKKVSFPLTLNWVKGEMGLKEILFQTTASTRAEADKSFTLQLAAPVGEDVVETLDVCTVTIEDKQGGVAAKPYVRALAWPANAGTVLGAGELANAKSYRTLTASTKSFATFAGWYKAKADDPDVIDLESPVEPYNPRNPRLIRVGYGSENDAGTYFAYFTNVLAVAAVVEPKAVDDETGMPLPGVAGIRWSVGGFYETVVGMKFSLPVDFLDDSGKGSLSVSKLPSGLAYNKKTGRIEGVPTKAGNFNAQFVASNAAGKHTVTYTFAVREIPARAVGTFYGVISEEDSDRTGIGSVAFTAGKTGSLSAKVLRRLSSTRSFSVKGYDYIDDHTFGVAMTNSYGEVLEATLRMPDSADKDVRLEGVAFGGENSKWTLAYYGETNGTFVAVRNAFATSAKDADAQQVLAAYKGTYGETLYATNGLGQIEASVGVVQYKVKDNGNVYLAAKIAKTYDGEKSVSAKTFSGTTMGGFLYDKARGIGGCAVVLRNGARLWSTEALFDFSTRDVTGQARYIRPHADKSVTEPVDVDQFVGAHDE